MHFVSHVLLDLTFAFLCQGAICYLQIKDVLEVLCDRLKRLIAKTLAALDVLHPVLFVEGHIEPLKLQRLIGWMHVSCWEGFCHPNHLFKSSKMFHWGLHHLLLEDIVSTRLHVNVLPIPRLFLVQRSLNEELDYLMEVFFQAVILHGRYWHSHINRLWKVLMKHLFPGCFVMALEHMLELHKEV